MKRIKYQNAPISEVVCGITLNEPLLSQKQVIYDIITYLKREYPLIHTSAPIADQYLTGNIINTNLNLALTGPGVYRLTSEDQKWMIQLQYNKLYLNWIRRDAESAGNYPGFIVIFNKLKEIIAIVEAKIKEMPQQIGLIENKVKYYELVYQDRFDWKDYVDDFSEINQILKIKLPEIPISKGSEEENKIYAPSIIQSKYFIPLPIGLATININSAPNNATNSSKELLIFECAIRSENVEKNLDEWFQDSHRIQIEFFEHIFQPNILELWKK